MEESRRTGLLIRKGLIAHESIVAADETYRFLLGTGECQYDAKIDMKLLALILGWSDLAEKVLRDVEFLKSDALEVEHAVRFKKLYEETRQVLNPSLSPTILTDWDAVLKQARKSFAVTLRSKQKSTQSQEFGEDLAIAHVLQVLRYNNLEASGVVGEELRELADLTRFPGTLFYELSEPVLLRKARELAETMQWTK
jgi:hypothetical protein